MRANELKKVMDESLPATSASAHSGFSKGSLGLYVIGTSVRDKKHSLNFKWQVMTEAQHALMT